MNSPIHVKVFLTKVCIMSAILAILIALFAASHAHAQVSRNPFNRVVVMIDASGSYKNRQTAAINKVDKMLSVLAERKAKRWEKKDEVILISLDALPEVIWKGTITELKAMKGTAWQRRFRARTDYAGCTDVAAGFQLAAQLFDQAPHPSQKYFLVFSDLKDEPPTTSPRKCRAHKAPSPPPQEIPWDQLADVSVAVFWMPPDQKFVWKKAVLAEGMEQNFAFYTTSESNEVELKAPPVARRVISESDRLETQEVFLSGGATLGKWLLYIGGAFTVLILIPVVFKMIGGRGRKSQRPVRVRGVVQPLPSNRLQGARHRAPLTRDKRRD